MGIAKVQIQVLPESYFPPNKNILIGHSLAKKLEIDHRPFWVRFGTAVDTGYSFQRPMHRRKIRISSQLATRLSLPHQSSLYAQFDPYTLQLAFGPILGVLINTLPDKDASFGQMDRFLRECSQLGRIHGISVIVFSPNQIYLERKRIDGWILDKGHWKKWSSPLPHAIYNRITSRRIEQEGGLQKRLEQLRTVHHIPIFNAQFLDKWQVHQLLEKDPQTSTFLPKTIPYHIRQIRPMWQKYQTLYIKPVNGSLGNGIIRLCRTGPGLYIFQFTTANGTKTRTTRSTIEVLKMIAQKVGQQKYVIQQGIPLIQHDGRAVDFRVLVQKNRSGQWAITSTVGRIANNQHIVSNIARGGTLRKTSELIKELQLTNKPSSYQLRRKALVIAQTFDRLADGHFAELGIDLAIDQKGKVWLLEINSKPSKTDDSLADPTQFSRPSVYRLLAYTRYITHFDRTSSKRRHSV